MQGYVMLHRKILDWEWYTDVNTKTLFIHLLLIANHRTHKWRGNEIKRGECVTSIGNLSMQTGLSVQNVRTALKNLEKTGDITIKSTNKNTLIMVVKYDIYQSDQQTTNNQLTKSQQTTNNQLTTNNNDKNDKNDKKDYIYTNHIIEVIDHLNGVCGTNYSIQNEEINGMIQRLLKMGFSVEEIKSVIMKKSNEWFGTRFERYLNPSTLFKPINFEKYLNQPDEERMEY